MATATAEKTQAKPAAKTKAASQAKTKAASSRPKYPDNIRAAARRVRELVPSKAPGPKQHVAVRKALGSEDPLKTLGLSEAKLKKFATGGDVPLSERTGLTELGKKVNDPFAKSRSLAAIVLAYVEERKAGEQSGS